MIVAALRESSWRRPEWTAAAIAASGWAVVGTTLYYRSHGGHEQHSHSHHDLASASLSSPDLAAWTVMVVAMMVPAALPAIRSIALASLWSRRQRAIAVFLGSYLAVWLAFGAIAVQAGEAAGALVDGSEATMLALALALAAAWELTPQKRRALRACHVIVPPPPHGWRADAGCARAGLIYGRGCVLSCWALMLPMVVGGHASMPLMALLAGIVAAQKLLVRGPELGVPACAAILAVCALVVFG